MAFGGIAEIFLGVRAEQRRLRTSRSRSPPRRPNGRGRARPLRRPAEDETERRHRARAERERRGFRRYRPGRGTASYSPFFAYPAEQRQQWLDNEVEIIRRALEDHGELSREDLARRIGARYWGPGRFRAALREALREGAVRRASRSTYAAGPGGDDASGPGQPEPGLT